MRDRFIKESGSPLIGHSPISAIAFVLRLGVFTLSANAAAGWAVAAPPVQTPEQVVDAYRKLDYSGERLTREGWFKAARFFLRPERRQQLPLFHVVDGESETWVDSNDGTRAIVSLRRVDLGQVDSMGRYTALAYPDLVDNSGTAVHSRAQARSWGPIIFASAYELVLTDETWEFTPDQKQLIGVKGKPQWRLVYFEYEPRVSVDAAIRYLIELQDKSNDATIRANAAKSIDEIRQVAKRWHEAPMGGMPPGAAKAGKQ